MLPIKVFTDYIVVYSAVATFSFVLMHVSYRDFRSYSIRQGHGLGGAGGNPYQNGNKNKF